MFADTDFLLALVKESDWLKSNAEKILKANRGRILTSCSVMIELALMCKKFRRNVHETFATVIGLVVLDDEEQEKCLDASIYIEKEGLNVFDAFHAAYCGNESIVSSDSVYEKVGIERIKLEAR
jgi:predicted nucleic acid-binding protein